MMAVQVVRGFFRWWGQELAGMVPRPPRSRKIPRSPYLFFDIGRDGFDVYHVLRGRKRELGHGSIPGAEKKPEGDTPGASPVDALSAILAGYRPQKTPVLVEIPADRMLSKRIKLPMAAEDTMHQVLGFEMERQTPFRADAVHFDFDIAERDPAQQSIEVDLRVVPRQATDPALATLAGWNLKSTQIIRQDDDAKVQLRFVSDRYKGSGSPRVLAALIGVNVALLSGLLLLPVAKQHAYVDVLSAELDRARASALVAAELEERVTQLENELRTLSARKQTLPTMVELVNEVSMLLPDSTWLQRLEVKNGEAHLRGISDAATSLIAVMEESDMFDEVRFRSPVTRDRVTGGERFYVSARIVARQEAAVEQPESDG